MRNSLFLITIAAILWMTSITLPFSASIYFYLWCVTPTRLQYLETGHFEHSGETGRQVVFPWQTNVSLMVPQCFLGTIFSSALSVSSGVFVLIQPNLLGIRWQCVSMGSAGIL